MDGRGSDPGSGRTVWTIVANRSAGSAEQRAVDAAAGRLAADRPVEVRWDAPLDEVAQILADDDRRLVIAGGDGTLHTIVNHLARLGGGGPLDRPVGILPLGTGNDLARGLGLPLDPIEAAERLAGSTPVALPVLVGPEGELILNNAHWGIGVQAARRAASLKSTLGRFAYRAGALDAGIRPRPFDVAVEVDGSEVFSGRACAALVAVGPSAGGGMTVAEDIELGEAVAHTVIVTEVGPWRRLRLGLVAARHGLSTAQEAVEVRGRRIVVRTDGTAEAEADGEFRTWPAEAAFTLRPAGWRVWR